MFHSFIFFFFFKQKTAYEIKECDWSSDVCSSDLWNFLDQSSSNEFSSPGKKLLLCAQVQNLLSHSETGKLYYDSARVFIENEIKL